MIRADHDGGSRGIHAPEESWQRDLPLGAGFSSGSDSLMLTENISTGLILSRKSIIPVTASSVTWIKIDIITGQNMAFFEPMFCFPRIKPGFFPMDVIPFRLLWLTLLASSSASSTYFHTCDL